MEVWREDLQNYGENFYILDTNLYLNIKFVVEV